MLNTIEALPATTYKPTTALQSRGNFYFRDMKTEESKEVSQPSDFFQGPATNKRQGWIKLVPVHGLNFYKRV